MQQLYRSVDGLYFESAEECQAHEAIMGDIGNITEWANSEFESKASRTRARNIVIAWEKARNSVLGQDYDEEVDVAA